MNSFDCTSEVDKVLFLTILVVDSSIQATNLKISSLNTNGTGEVSVFFSKEQKLAMNLKFDSIDVGNFLSFNNDNLIEAFSDKILTNNTDSSSINGLNAYINFDLLDEEGVSIQFDANKMVIQNLAFQNVSFDFNVMKGLVNKGNLYFEIKHDEHSTKINLKDLIEST